MFEIIEIIKSIYIYNLGIEFWGSKEIKIIIQIHM